MEYVAAEIRELMACATSRAVPASAQADARRNAPRRRDFSRHPWGAQDVAHALPRTLSS